MIGIAESPFPGPTLLKGLSDVGPGPRTLAGRVPQLLRFVLRAGIPLLGLLRQFPYKVVSATHRGSGLFRPLRGSAAQRGHW